MSVQNDYETMALNKPGQQQEKKSSSKWGSVFVSLALIINTVLLVGVFVSILGVKGRVNETLIKVDQIVDAVEKGEPTPEMLSFTNQVFSSATSYFFLGSFNGTVAGYVQDMLQYDYSGFANSYLNFANKVSPQFQGSTDSVEQGILTALNAIKSVATQVAQFQNVQGNAVTNAAMSEGIFRLDHILEFVRAQSDVASWKEAGGVCKTFSQQMKSISWSGSYTDGKGFMKTWDITETMNKVIQHMENICGKVSAVTP